MSDGVATPAPLDPIVSLAVAVAESPGAYAFLLGAGVSKDAGVPTGGDVLSIALNDLYRLVHPEDDQPDEATLATWAAGTGYANIPYSEMLELLGPDPEGRRAYLAKYFEGLEPGETHRLLARLAADGLVRVFVTTNFDRLLEQALREVGITPVVITAGDELSRASGREHARCYVLKVHGDYFQQTIRNTATELAKLDKKIEGELREVFDRFGVVALGYSGSDEAVGRCLRRRNSRYGAYWVSRSEPAEAAAALVEALHARVIRRDTATDFLTDLTRRIAAFRIQPSGETPDIVMSEIVNLLRQNDRVGLHEKLRREWRVLEKRIQGSIEPRASLQSVEVDVAKAVDAELTPGFERMLAALLPLIDHDEELFAEQLDGMRRILDRVNEQNGNWPALHQWVVWQLAQACGAYAMSRGRFGAVAALLRTNVQDRKVGKTLATLIPADIGDLIACGAFEPAQRRNTGAGWRHLAVRLDQSRFLRESYPEIVEQPDGALRWMSNFNFVACFGANRERRTKVIGYWMRGTGAEHFAQRLARDHAFADDFARGCFRISGSDLLATIKPTMANAISDPGRSIIPPGGGWADSDAIDYLPDPPAETGEPA